MAGLVSYGSSDEEDNDKVEIHRTDASKERPPVAAMNGTKATKAQEQSIEVAEAPLVGPVMAPENRRGIPLPDADTLDDGESNRQSPYSANRALLRDLTLPTAPSNDIPPSPPGSPKESTNAKFKHFLELKKQGVHFNEKLSKSSAMKNPGLFQKLMDFADIDETEQYATTLSKEVWDPGAAPEYAFKEELAKNQQKVLKAKEEEKSKGQREGVDFVPSTLSGESSRSGTPGAGGGRMCQKSAAERVMAGLDRGRSNSPSTQGQKRKSRFGPDANP